MKLITTYLTDVGIEKKYNQDSLCLQVASTSIGKIVLCVVCDGMGGLEKGELASSSVVFAFKQWFSQDLPQILLETDINDEICYQWKRIIKEQNQRINVYGKQNGIQLGTTVTALLMFETGQLLIGHVGDTRVYRISSRIEQMTEDQTVVNMEVNRGALTIEQAELDPRRNVLLQCVGSSKTVEPEFIVDEVHKNETYLVCSDGFRHKISSAEIFSSFEPSKIINTEMLEIEIKAVFEEIKKRGETDNITAVVIRT